MIKTLKLTKGYMIEGNYLKKGDIINIKPALQECIIATSKCKGDNVFLVKNRDRAYYGRIEIIQDMVDDIERVYFFDIETGYIEGLSYNHKTNEVIGVLNTALSVDFDESEKKMAQETNQRSIEGQKILKLISTGDIKKSVKAFKDDLYVTGHTFIVSVKADKKIGTKFEVAIIMNEETEEETLMLDEKDIDLSLVSVRTNHAEFLNSDEANIGYTVGDNFLSSQARKHQMEIILTDGDARKDYTVPDILTLMKVKNYPYDSLLNMQRDCIKMNDDEENIGMRTIGQIGLDLTNKTFYYDPLNNKSEIINIINKIPEGIEAKLMIEILNKDDIEIVEYNT